MYIAIISLLNTNFLETAEPIEEYHTAGDSHGALAPVGSRSSFKHLTPYNNSVSVTVKTLPQSKLPPRRRDPLLPRRWRIKAAFPNRCAAQMSTWIFYLLK